MALQTCIVARTPKAQTDEREGMGGLACMRAPGGDDVELRSADVGRGWMMRYRQYCAGKEEKEDAVKVMVKDEEHEDALVTLDTPTPIQIPYG